jgi:hypothetical protein
MPDTKPLRKPQKKLSQKRKFIEAAKAAECDESGETFMRAFQKIVKAPPIENPRRRK